MDGWMKAVAIFSILQILILIIDFIKGYFHLGVSGSSIYLVESDAHLGLAVGYIVTVLFMLLTGVIYALYRLEKKEQTRRHMEKVCFVTECSSSDTEKSHRIQIDDASTPNSNVKNNGVFAT
ncbi:unnamed protein product [Owenia fusiformis]|uniref:Uncharacterized protein n=1 Tax=Owenia fusiformis TaxID=6347 RepID=A0A8S4MXX9_OWEFU|nr:unnamed protein product [Owenia fusiformis]